LNGETSGGRKPLDLSTANVPRGQVYVIPGRCKGCGYCIEFCPTQVLVESKDINAKGYHYAVVRDGEGYLCVNCQFCNLVCPEMAIYTEEVPKETEDKPDGVAEG
jgi:2-oxoglutarate ferredoxin oxidoreductase subunit delta